MSRETTAGMDPARIEGLSERLQTMALELERLGQEVQHDLSSLPWAGQDADTARDKYTRLVVAPVPTTAQVIRALALSMVEEAAAQRATSARH